MTDRFVFHVDPRNAACTKSELQIQIAFRNQMKKLAPDVMIVAIPNEGKRSKWEAIKRGREGLYPGFPDIMVLYDGKCRFIEFKAGTGALSDNQIDCFNALVARNHTIGVFRSADTAIEWLRRTGVPIL